ncbi:MAG: polyphosphate kinase 2 family protein [Peptoniphilus sp.]|nr:polyphosphate kinase 2 family protein [Peptoniphilus sp.]MDY6045097.1 polyphosphate kinase 2 family protein [Peptoniphilus sp.]
MKFNRYRVAPGSNVHLEDYDTSYDGPLTKKQVNKELLPANLEKMSDYQAALYAENTRGIVVVLQAMDAAGKDGLIKHVFTALNPQGVQVTPFKEPTSLELDHDYLWRIAAALPRRGNIAIFNRSHYEDVLVTRVHRLLRRQPLPPSALDENIWTRRFEEIRNFEQYLYDNGFRVVKFFLHISKDEQRERLLDRIDVEEKNWKFSSSDVREREYWGKYQKAYEDLITHTSTEIAPWYIVPADRKWYTRYVVSEIFKDLLEDMKPTYPELPEKEKKHLNKWRSVLERED